MRFKKSLFVILSITTLLSRSDAAEQGTDYKVINDKSKLPILSPGLVMRKTQKIQLENGLQALLISDPKTELSGAMISVKSGSWDDPSTYPGLAHFLEHMLFLGTLKYPKESEYESFIADHGGQSNAFTTENSTNYLFTVGNNAFQESLSRFSSFFKEPLFNPSGVSRELNAIDQEYAKNIESDTYRQIYVLKELADPRHPFNHFSSGNSASLAKAKRDTLDEWFRSHYSANLMKLIVYSPLPVDKLADLVVQDFSGIPNKNRLATTIEFPAFKVDGEKKFVYIEPIRNTRTLTLVWELPAKFSNLKVTQPDLILSYILGNEGEKTLLAQLKRENLAESLASGATKIGNNLTLFFLEIDLTTEGLHDLDHVIARCFQAIKALETNGVPSYLFDEIQKMATIEYQYQSRENEFQMLMKHAGQIHEEDLSTYPEHVTVVQQFSPSDIQELLKWLTPQNALYLVTAPSNVTGIKPDKKEKWVGVEYAVKTIPRDLVDKWKHVAVSPEINVPPPNIFMPDDLRLVSGTFSPSDRLIPDPSVVADTQKIRAYFAHDDKYGLPKVSWSFDIRTPSISMADPIKIVHGDIFVKSLKENLNKIGYQAKMAGLDYEIKRSKNGIRVEITGYNQNAPRLLEEILRAIVNYTPDQQMFKTIKDVLLRDYQNFSLESPLEQALELFKSVLYQDFVTESDKALAIRKINFPSYGEFAATLFDKVYIDTVLFGNMTEEGAKSVVFQLENTFKKEAYAKADQLKDGVIVLPNTQGPYFLESATKSLGNAVLLAIENQNFSFKERAAQQILMQAIKEPFFNQLRTKQQTGYLVHSFSEEVERKLFNMFAVQSNTHDVRDLLSRFEQFIEGYVQEIGKTTLSEDQFESIKNALFKQYSESAKNIVAMGDLLSTLAFDYDGDFDWVYKRLEGFRDLKYQEFEVIAKSFLGRSNKRRLGILLKGEIPEENTFSYTRARTWNALRKMSEYQYR